MLLRHPRALGRAYYRATGNFDSFERQPDEAVPRGSSFTRAKATGRARAERATTQRKRRLRASSEGRKVEAEGVVADRATREETGSSEEIGATEGAEAFGERAAKNVKIGDSSADTIREERAQNAQKASD